MAKITNRFVHFKTKASFTSRLGAGDIQESSVVFIQDANEIWTHGTYYKCDISEAEVIALINSKGYITEADIPSLTGGAAATSGQYVSGVTVSGHNVTVTKAALPTASSSVLGGVKIGSNISVSSGTISLTSANVTSALGFTPAKTSDIPEIPIALPNPYALTINGTSYTGSSAVDINTARILSTSTLSSSTVSAGYSYNNTSSRTISSLSGFSSSNPDSVIISTAKLTFTASNAIKMDGLADLSGTYYIYCLSYMANGKIAVNGAVYA